MMRRMLAAAALGLLFVTGCAKPAQSKGVIGVSLLTLENPFFKVIGDNIRAEATKAGYDVIILSANNDPAKQSDQVKDFLVKKVAAIVLSPCETRAVVPAIQEANKENVPVFTVDIPCREPGVKIVCQIATDNQSGGREAAKAMQEALGEAGGQVAIVHMPQAESCRLRVKGFRDVLDPVKDRFPIVAELDGAGDKAKGEKAASDLLQAHPNLRGIFAINDPSALGALVALEKAGKTGQVTLISFDGQPEGKAAIDAGKIFAEPIQYPEKMGVEVVRAIQKHSKGEELPAELLIPTTLYRRAGK